MSIVAQRLDENGIYIKLMNEKEFSITTEQIRALITTQGSKPKALKALMDSLGITVGDLMDMRGWEIDFDDVTGMPTLLRYTQVG